MSGVERIAAERQRQIEAEGWTLEHDDEHVRFELARAAVVYAMPPVWREENDIANVLLGHRDLSKGPEPVWPRGWQYKPNHSDRIRELVKAGALIAAEIDRLERAKEGS